MLNCTNTPHVVLYTHSNLFCFMDARPTYACTLCVFFHSLTTPTTQETHEAKHELLVKQQDIQRRNLKSTFEAERKKVAM